MSDLIDRQALYEKTAEWEAQALHMVEKTMNDEDQTEWRKWSTILTERSAFKFDVADAPSAQPTLYGYNIDHLEVIARVLQKEDLPPERVVDVLTDIGHIVGIICDEFEETLRATIDGRTINGTERTDRPNL